jgi:hypothetical protein
MEVLFSRERNRARRVLFITDLKNVESGGNFPVSFSKLVESRFKEHVFFFSVYMFSSLTK